MAVDDPLAHRPRTSGEILDDAWRLYRADGVWLLVLSGLFQVPAFAALLVLLARPLPASLGDRLLLPLVTASLLLLTGLGSGACQELFRRRAQGQGVTLAGCLAASLRRGLGHLAARAAGLVGILLGLGCLVMPGLTLWMGLTTIHAALAGSKTGSLGEIQIGREARFDPGKTAAVTLSRLPLAFLTFFNLYLFLQAGFWVAANLAGLDVALWSYQLSLDNLLFVTALALFGWLLLTPYFEASNFLLHLDTRVRQEGLDLLHRAQRAFAVLSTPRVASVLLMGFFLSLAPSAWAAGPLDTIRSVREQLQKISAEVKAADPYRGGQRWKPRLEGLVDQLEQAERGRGNRYRWFHQGIEAFVRRDQEGALGVLADLDNRLALLEESLTPVQVGPPPAEGRPRLSRDEIKGLLRPEGESGKAEAPPHEARKERQKRPKEEQVKDNKNEPDGEEGPGAQRRSGSGLLAPVTAGLSLAGWLLLAGLFLAIVATAVFLWLQGREPGLAGPKTGTNSDLPEAPLPAPPEQSPAALFRQAEELARAGRFKEAVRALYWAVLSLLHRRQLVRYETTRTNGEYVQQIRLAPQAPSGLQEPFEQLTRHFDLIWYGDLGCTGADYATGRGLAEEIRTIAGE